jgi:cellulose synthase/poly-beta-1,6-N-acetylglucosamine synthase-like glycosyltransferase
VTDARGVVLLAVDLAAIVALLVLPLRRSFDDADKGRGNVVVLPPPKQATLTRIFTFIVICVLGSIALVAIRTPDLTALYKSAVAHLTSRVVAEPAVVDSYVKTLRPIIPISIFAFVVALAVTLPSTPGRRLVVLLHAPMALAAALVADTGLAVFGLETHIPLGPLPLVSILFHYGIAYLLGMRLAVTTYQLPRPTQVPIRRHGDAKDNLITIAVLIAVFAGIGAFAVLVLRINTSDVVLYGFVIIALPTYLKFGIYAVLSFLRLFQNKPPEPVDPMPPINVIAPAYNEEANITAWVEHLDIAATVYGGPVHIILCDDGSTDHTKEWCEAAMARCASATGDVIAGGHKGKSTALNLALSHCTSDIVIRHDSDCWVHPNSFRYTVPWFGDPKIGLVGAFMLPKMPFTTWIDRMRALELAVGFGMPRLGYSVIDSQPCVPGNYTAFRRSEALELGGFAEGMFGEDIDFTCSMARLGWRAVYDRRVWAYEDVPNTVEELRVQRRRWNRGSVHNFARFIPPAAGSCGPRFWLCEFLRAARRLVMPLQFAAYLFILQATVFNPTSKVNLAHLLAFMVIAKLPGLIFVVLAMAYRGLIKTMAWWPLFLVFAFIKREANLEALLTLPTRKVTRPWRWSRVRDPSDNRELDWPVLRPRFLPVPD